MRYLGLDFGDKLIGLALSDESATVAGGLDTLRRIGPRKDPKALAELVRKHEVGGIVVGLPRKLDGSVGIQAQKVLDFVEDLRRVVKVPVVTWDERFTSVVAQRALIEGDVGRKARKGLVDKVSAILILQNYLDYLKLADAEARKPTV